ncbi:MAG: hypothetical protein WCK53_10835, partial [Methanomicrobiales archaeon]
LAEQRKFLFALIGIGIFCSALTTKHAVHSCFLGFFLAGINVVIIILADHEVQYSLPCLKGYCPAIYLRCSAMRNMVYQGRRPGRSW